MGWTGVHKPSYLKKKYFLESELFGMSGQKHSVLQHSTKGSVHYMAVRNNQTNDVFAMVVLTSENNKEYYNFYYKEMDETCSPCYYDAPASLLGKLTPTESEYATQWRSECWKKINEGKVKKKVKVENGNIIRFSKPIEFTNHEVLDTFTVRKYGKKTRFLDGMCQYSISGWQNREYEIIK
jgi:hypothetical protein